MAQLRYRPLPLRPGRMEVDVNFNKVKRPRKRLSLLKRVTSVHVESRITHIYYHTLSCGHVVVRTKEYKNLVGCHQCAHAVNQFTRSLKV